MNTPKTNASPTPNGKATAIPATDTEAERRILEALKITPPISALAIYRCYFFFVESDDAPVALEYCLYHNLLCLNVTVFFSLIAETKIL